MKNLNKFLVMLAFLGLSISGTYATTYIITKSGSDFIATVEGVGELGIPRTLLQTKIDEIRIDALGAPCTIQFGDGSEVLDLGGSTTPITFNGTWGLITLTGNATASYENTGGCIRLEDGVSIDCKAILELITTNPNGRMIRNNSTGTVNISSGGWVVAVNDGTAITNYSTGTVNINDGWVIATTGTAVSNFSTGAVNISGGRIEATTGNAVYNYSTGKITVSGTAIITSENNADINGYPGTIHLANFGTETGCRLEITGGRVGNTGGVGAIAIFNNSTGAVNISGGTVIASLSVDNAAIFNNSTGTVNISGGTVSAYLYAVLNYSTGAVNISGGTTWGYTIAVFNYSTGTVSISDGTVSSLYLAVSNVSAGMVNISGGMIYGYAHHALTDYSIGMVNISGGILFSFGTKDTDVIESAYYSQTGNAVIVAWNQAAGTTTYTAGTNDDIYKLPATATAVWAKKEGNGGISVANGTNTGFIPIEFVTVEGETGIATVETDNLSVYPNPTNDVLNFSLETSYKITDLQGRILQESNTAVKSANISSLPAGIYFVILTTGTGKSVKKIIKK